MMNSVVGKPGMGGPPQFNRGPSKTRPQSPIGPSPQSMGAMMGQGQPMQMAGQAGAAVQNWMSPGGGFNAPGGGMRPQLPTPPAPVEAPEAVPGAEEQQQNKQQMQPPGIGPARPELMEMLRQRMGGNTGITGNMSQWGRPSPTGRGMMGGY